MNLDELLNQIREEGKKNTALAAPTQYVEERGDDLVDEQIDEVILRILGIENVNDIDFSTYKSLLREKMVEGRMADSKMPSDEVELLTNEFKRVKRNTGRFKIKKKPITATSVVSNNPTRTDTPENVDLTNKTPTTPTQNTSVTDIVKGVTSTEQEEQSVKSTPATPQQDLTDIADSLAIVATNMNKIVAVLEADLKTEKKKEEKERKEVEKAKKRGKEEKLEGQSKKFVEDLKNRVMSPVFNIFDFLGRFLKNVLLGGVVVGLIKLLENPAKILNPLIELLNNIINAINLSLRITFGIMFAPINALIEGFNKGFQFLETQLNNVLKTFGAEEIELPKIPTLEAPQIPNVPLIESPSEGGGEESKVDSESTEDIDKKIDSEQSEQTQTPGMEGGGVIPSIVQSFTEGGSITGESGQKISGMGPDTQLIAAQPGEIVMSTGAVEMFGADTLLAMNAMGGGTNKPKMGTPNLVAMTTGGMVPGYKNGGMVGVSNTADYDVIIPLDHVRPENMRSVPDTPGGSTYKNASETGADGREREHQEPAVRIISERLRDQGLRVLVYTPEMAGDYQTYDKFIQEQSTKGTRIAPIHFDASEDKSGRVVGTGFLTRTRDGDTDDATFAAPIQQVLADFQKDNPDLGRIAQDTEGNKTVSMGADSPTALIELGMMTRWEEKHGKKFTESEEFKEFATNVADAIVVGGGFDQSKNRSSSVIDSSQMGDHPDLKIAEKNLDERFKFLEEDNDQKTRRQEDIDLYREMMRPTSNSALVTPGNIGPTLTEEQVAKSQTPLVSKPLTKNDQLFALNMRAEKVLNMEGNKGTKQKIMVPGVGSFVSGTGFFGRGQDKYFDVEGNSISQEEFHGTISSQQKRLEREKKVEDKKKQSSSSRTSPQTFSRTSPQTFSPSRSPQTPSAPTRSSTPIVINAGGGRRTTGRAGGSMQRQKSAPFFSSMDHGNPESIVVRSIYNIVG